LNKTNEDEKEKWIILKIKKKEREKDEEGEMKGHGCWPSPYPQLSLFPPWFSLLKGIFSKERRENNIVTKDS